MFNSPAPILIVLLNVESYCFIKKIREEKKKLLIACNVDAVQPLTYLTFSTKGMDKELMLHHLFITNSVFIPQSLVLGSIVLGPILIYPEIGLLG